nr:MAG TPA: hypothetical protein [Caudoviricetes sp.]
MSKNLYGSKAFKSIQLQFGLWLTNGFPICLCGGLTIISL